MKFPFKTLERQLEQGGYQFIGNQMVYEWESETFSGVSMQNIGERLEEWQRIKKFNVDQVFLRVRPMRDGEQAGCSDYRKEKVIEIYVPRN